MAAFGRTIYLRRSATIRNLVSFPVVYYQRSFNENSLTIFILSLIGLVEKALNAGLGSATDFVTVWLSFIEYLVRQCKWDDEEKVAQVREAFTRATDHISQSMSVKECIF